MTTLHGAQPEARIRIAGIFPISTRYHAGNIRRVPDCILWCQRFQVELSRGSTTGLRTELCDAGTLWATGMFLCKPLYSVQVTVEVQEHWNRSEEWSGQHSNIAVMSKCHRLDTCPRP